MPSNHVHKVNNNRLRSKTNEKVWKRLEGYKEKQKIQNIMNEMLYNQKLKKEIPSFQPKLKDNKYRRKLDDLSILVPTGSLILIHSMFSFGLLFKLLYRGMTPKVQDIFRYFKLVLCDLDYIQKLRNIKCI